MHDVRRGHVTSLILNGGCCASGGCVQGIGVGMVWVVGSGSVEWGGDDNWWWNMRICMHAVVHGFQHGHVTLLISSGGCRMGGGWV